MADATGRPRRMRYSFETRHRAVAAMLAGVSPGAAAQALGASRATGYRWWARYHAGKLGGAPSAELRVRKGREARHPRRASIATAAPRN